jgi:hypothetical protein
MAVSEGVAKGAMVACPHCTRVAGPAPPDAAISSEYAASDGSSLMT